MNDLKTAEPGQDRRREKLWAVLFCTALAAAALAIASMSSPLYPMNTWCDVNCYVTMGRGILQGKVLYRDLFDHKGPLLYFLYALFMAPFPRSFFGVFLAETACFSAFLYYSGKCASLYLERRWMIWAVVPVLAAAICTSDAFALGSSVEEMALFPAAASLYMVLRAVREKRPVPGREAFVIGLYSSFAFWIKYTLCGFFAGLALFVALYYWKGLQQPKRLPAVIGWFLLGLAPVTAAVLVYFIANGALAELWDVYFYDNLFLYSSAGQLGLFARIGKVIWNTYATLWYNRLFMGLALLGMLWLLATVRTWPWETLAAYLSFGSMIFLVFIGGMSSAYYGLYFAAFSIFGLIALMRLVQRLGERTGRRLPAAACAAVCAVLLAGSLAYTYRYGRNGYWRTDRQSTPQYQFARIIQAEQDQTLLFYGDIDSGFYFAAEQVPAVRYFSWNNLPLPEMWVEQNRYVREGVTNFVVVTDQHQEQFLEQMSGYRLVAESGDCNLYQRD